MARLWMRALSLMPLLALSACGTVTLRGPVPVDAMRPVIKCDFMAANDFQSVEAVKTDKCPKYSIGMPLRPGMVLYLSTLTWGPGLGSTFDTMDPGGGLPQIEVGLSVGSRQPEVAAPLRLPVRHLGSAGHLTPEETIVLGSVLSLQRKALLGAPVDTDVDNTSTQWKALLSNPATRRALWNAFVDSASLRRVSAGEIPALSLVLSPEKFCSRMKGVLSPNDFQLLKDGLFPQECVGGGTNTIEAFALATDATRAEPLQGLASTRTTVTSEPFFQGKWMLFNAATVVSAELDAISMKRLEGVERRWSLAEWEQSGVCGSGREIVSIWTPGAMLFFQVLPTAKVPVDPNAPLPTFMVEESLTTDGVHRTVKPTRNPFLRQPTIAKEDLTKLRPTDIGNIRWSTPWGGPSIDPCAS